MTSLDTFETPPAPNPKWIGNMMPSRGYTELLADTISTYSTGTVSIIDPVLNGSIAGDVLGAPNGLATLDASGLVPLSQLPPIGASLDGDTTPLNTFLGVGAGTAITAGVGNTAEGVNALNLLTTGTSNTAIGDGALGTTTTASSSTAVGYRALSIATSGPNTALGFNALSTLTTGVNNVAVGAGTIVTTGSRNAILGADASAVGYNNCVVLGYGATATDDNQLIIASAVSPVGTTSLVGATGTAMPLPSAPQGYLKVVLNGNPVVIPYYTM